MYTTSAASLHSLLHMYLSSQQVCLK